MFQRVLKQSWIMTTVLPGGVCFPGHELFSPQVPFKSCFKLINNAHPILRNWAEFLRDITKVVGGETWQSDYPLLPPLIQLSKRFSPGVVHYFIHSDHCEERFGISAKWYKLERADQSNSQWINHTRITAPFIRLMAVNSEHSVRFRWEKCAFCGRFLGGKRVLFEFWTINDGRAALSRYFKQMYRGEAGLWGLRIKVIETFSYLQ